MARSGIRLVLFVFLLVFLGAGSVFASSFVPPSQITVRMYRLYDTGAKYQPEQLCSSGNTKYGCTAFCDNYGSPTCEASQVIGYPYGQNPATVPMETDYLLDVVPRELSVEAFHPTAIQAQAIAARSYAY